MGRCNFESRNFEDETIDLKETTSESLLGTSIPTLLFPGIGTISLVPMGESEN